MKIYVAARFKFQDYGRAVRTALESLGHVVTSTWLDEVGDPAPIAAARDLQDIDRSDALVLLSAELDEPPTRGGAWTEFGYALGQGKAVYLYGPLPKNIFAQAPGVKHIHSLVEIQLEDSNAA